MTTARRSQGSKTWRALLLAMLAAGGCSTVVAPPGADGAAGDAAPDLAADALAPDAPGADAPPPEDVADAPPDVAADVLGAGMPPGTACTATDVARCPAGAVCVNGYCARMTSGMTYFYCEGRTPMNLAVDPDHCGRCGNACAADAQCVGGACVACRPDAARCGGAACSVDLRANRAHCGACGHACAAAERCVAGACAACPAGSTMCSPDTCVDTTRNDAHCGGCDVRCLPLPRGASACAAGRCVVAACAAGTADCDGDFATPCEAVTAIDRAHCGACGRACAAGETCVDGRCAAEGLRLRAPPSFTTVTSARPTLWWFPAAGSSGSRVQVCRDAACATVVAQWDVAGNQQRAESALAPGVYHWRVTALREGRPDAASSPTWQFRVDAAARGIHGYTTNSLGDLNGDNRPDGARNEGVWLGAAGGEVPAYVASTTAASRSSLVEAAALGDVDGDGYGDAALSITVSFDGGTIQYTTLMCHGDPSRGARCAGDGGFSWSNTSRFAGGDFNHDGTNERVVVSGNLSGGDVAVGGARFPLRVGSCWHLGTGTTAPAALVRDLNDDGYDDLDATSSFAGIRLLGGPGGATVAPCDP
jgi:hypothetical protein